MIVDPEVTTARTIRNLAKGRLARSWELAKARLAPHSLANEAVDGVKTMVSDLAKERIAVAREHPAKTAAVVGAVGLALLGRPLLGWFRSRGDATEDDDAS